MSLDKVVALVPMRHESVRVPGKNYRLLAGKPLYYHVLESLLACPEIDQVLVDTDSPVILQGLKEKFPKVIGLERSEHLRADTIPTNEILMYDTSQIEADLFLQTHCTNPLLRTNANAPVGSAWTTNQPQPCYLVAHSGSATDL